MEIERKFLVDLSDLPFDPKDYPARKIEQAYLCTAPVVRIRRDNDDFFLTYKSKGMMVREDYNLPLTKESYYHLLLKADGRIITKTRYVIPIQNGLFVELDIFEGDLFRFRIRGFHAFSPDFPDRSPINRKSIMQS